MELDKLEKHEKPKGVVPFENWGGGGRQDFYLPSDSFHCKYRLSVDSISLYQPKRENFGTNSSYYFPNRVSTSQWTSSISHKAYESNKEHTGSVVCPASSIMHTSNLMLASKGLEMPKQVTATTLTCSNRIFISSTLCTFDAVIEISVKRILYKNIWQIKTKY